MDTLFLSAAAKQQLTLAVLEIVVFISVSDKSGNPITGLHASAFTVAESTTGAPLQIEIEESGASFYRLTLAGLNLVAGSRILNIEVIHSIIVQNQLQGPGSVEQVARGFLVTVVPPYGT